MRHFKKSLPRTALILSNGRKLLWEAQADGLGYLATEDPFLISELAKMIERQKGGITELTQPEYEEALKKNSNPTPSEKPSSRQPRQRVNVWPPNLLSPKKSAVQDAPAPSAVERKPRPSITPSGNKPFAPVSADEIPFKPGVPAPAMTGKWKAVPKTGKFSDLGIDVTRNTVEKQAA